jgi:hypothetical protein
MEQHEPFWKRVTESEPLETFGFEGSLEPEPVRVNLDGMIDLFKAGYNQYSPLWKDIFSKDSFGEVQKARELDSGNFYIPTTVWVQILYELAATFHLWTYDRQRLLDLVTPLYYARVASFVRQSWEMSSLEAEELVEEQAMRFEEQKDYLIRIWDQKSAQRKPA